MSNEAQQNTVTLDAVTMHRIKAVRERAKKQHGKYAGDMSFSFALELVVRKGSDYIEMVWDSSDKRENDAAYLEAVKRLNAGDKDFTAQFQALQHEYRIGGTKITLS